MTRETLINSPAYWFEHEQNELFRQVSEYMQDEQINRTELANRLNVSKGYVSQILNGNFNYTLKKLIELCLSIGIVPQITYKKIDDVIKNDVQNKANIDWFLSKPEDNIIPFYSYNDMPVTFSSTDFEAKNNDFDFNEDLDKDYSWIHNGNTVQLVPQKA